MTSRKGVDATEGLTPSRCSSTPTAITGQDTVRSGSDDSIEQSNSGDSGDRLQPSRFGLDIDDEFLDRITGDGVDEELVEKATTDPEVLDDLLDEVTTDAYAEQVADLWDTAPIEEWWP